MSSESTPMVPFIGSLMPASVKMPKENRLKISKQIYTIALEALEAFRREEFYRFDALVGDSACQIRAYQVAMLAGNRLPVEETISTFREKREGIECGENPDRIMKAAECSISPDILSLVRFFLLCKAKEQEVFRDGGGFLDYKEKTAHEKIGTNGEEWEKLAQKALVKRVKKQVAKESVSFVQRKAEKLSPSLQEAVRFKFKGQLPFFHLTRVVFERAMQDQVPVLLRIRQDLDNPLLQESYRFRAAYLSDGKCYKRSALTDLACKVGMVIDCRAKTLDRDEQLSGIDLLDLIDLNTAQHTQFSRQPKDGGDEMFDSIKGVDQAERKRLAALRNRAISEGFSNVKPKVCCIEHIFCDRLDRTFTTAEAAARWS